MFAVPLGVVDVCQAGTSRTQPAVELDRAAEVGVGHVLDPVVAQLVGDLDDRHALRSVRLAMSTTSPQWSRVAVGQEDVRRVDLATARRRPWGCR